jgi:hypothetical protein
MKSVPLHTTYALENLNMNEVSESLFFLILDKLIFLLLKAFLLFNAINLNCQSFNLELVAKTPITVYTRWAIAKKVSQ